MKFDWPLVDKPPHVPDARVVDIDIYNLPAAESFHQAWSAFQASAPADVVWTPRNGGHWLIAKGSLIPAAYRDYARFSSRIVLVPKEVGEQYHFVPNTVDPPEHRKYRGLLSSGLAPRAVKRIELRVRARAAALIDGFQAAGACDFTADFASKLPVYVFMEMCGLPPEDGPGIKYWADQFTRPDGTVTIEQATEALYDYLADPIDARRANPTDDFLSEMVNGTVEGERLSREEAMSVSAQVLLGGLDTVGNGLSFMMHHLATDPALQQRLVAEPQPIAAATDEFLRRFPLATSTRVVDRDTDLGGVELREGDMLVIPSTLHGLDPRENIDPLTVDIDRKNANHSTFGAGAHRCPGSYLARSEFAIVLEEWLARIPSFAIAPDAEIEWHGGVVASLSSLPLVWPVSESGGKS